MFINSKPQKCEIKVRVDVDANSFYASNMQVYTGKTWSKGEEAGPSSCQRVSSTYGTVRGVTTDKFLTSWELSYFLLSRIKTLIGMLRKNEPEIPVLFLSGKQRNIFFCLWLYQWCNTGTICTSKKQGCHLPLIRAYSDMHGRGRYTNLKLPGTVMPLELGFDVLDKLVKEYTCMRSTRCLCKCLATVDAEKS